jgi:hypothetical protein
MRSLDNQRGFLRKWRVQQFLAMPPGLFPGGND